MAEVWFNPDALDKVDTGVVDLSRFEQGEQLPGTYRVDVYVNGIYFDSGNYPFVALEDGRLQPLLTSDMLRAMGVKIQAFAVLVESDEAMPLSHFSTYIPGAQSVLYFEQQRLDISIPQAAMDLQAHGTIDPARWDQGMPAAFVGYNVTGSRTWQRNMGQTRDNHFVNLQSGLNLGDWRLRNYSTYSDASNSSHAFRSINTYLYRDIQALQGQLVLGQSSTPSEIFDSIIFRGIKLVSDDAMLPESLRGFAPIVRGIAWSNAMVTVRQNGIVIYQTYVAPGAFEIKDLFPTSASGDLEVTITEADGSKRRFSQPFSSVPNMLREGSIKYAFAAGQYHSQQTGAREPGFGMTTLSYGISNNLTLYSGVLVSDRYISSVVGSGLGLGAFGSASVDVTYARTELPDNDTKHGVSYRMQYAKTLTQTDTTLTLASYRYSTQDFYTFQEANEYGIYDANKRSRFQVTLSQSLGHAGNLYLSAYQQNYWNRSSYDRTINIGWSGSYRRINYVLNYNQTQNAGYGRTDRQLSFSIQIPLDGPLRNNWIHTSSTATQHNGTITQMGVSGTALADHNLSYSVSQGYASRDHHVNGNLSASYRGTMGEINAGYNYDKYSRRLNFGLQGGVFVHPYGITLSQIPGESMALVRIPEISDAKIHNQMGIATDAWGNAVVPYLSAYRSNRIAVDTLSLQDHVDLDETTREVVPTRGALVLANFNARVGSRVLFTLTHHGSLVPFGATAKVVGQDNDSIVADWGQVYFAGLPSQGKLEVSWGGGQKCQTEFNFQADHSHGIRQESLNCE
ncbi:fimbria/pilus outer membrane usher protein [Saezia sanguinis]|uniref:fimbria/pilus outer membrane usher protein n=1 Tax=Saezia sanguinis TaxID=1965230 RepID=UPI0019507758|nr:fimbria/pilus outer membrane usher protein [Saezia sanguinis]